MTKKQLVHVGTIGKPHGVHGLVRLHAYVENPVDLEHYDELIDDFGECWTLSWKKEGVATLFDKNKKQILSRTEVKALVNRKLYVKRESLPHLEEEEFYLIDLIGLQAYVQKSNQAELIHGIVEKIHDYGAGTSLEIKLNTNEVLIIPFTKACVPEVNISSGWLKIHPPHEIEVLPAKESL